MYEEKRIEFDWKGFLLKLAFLIIVIILIIKLLPLDNKNTFKELSSEFQNNMATLREKSSIYFRDDKLPGTDEKSTKVSLDDLIQVGAVRDLKDTSGNSCDVKNSYVKASNKTSGYELEVYLICGKEIDKSYVYLANEKNSNETTTTTTKVTSKQTTKPNNGGSNNSGGSSQKPVQTITSKIIKTTKAATNVSVIFNSNGGTAVKAQYVQIGKAATRPVNPVKTGYIFLGWYLDNKEYNFNSAVNSNTILIARWSIIDKNNTTTSTTKKTTTTQKIALTEYIVTFNSNGGTSKSSQIVRYGNYVTKPSNPVKSNAIFIGWYLNNELFDFNTRIYNNITLIAKYLVTETLTTDVYSSGYGTQLTFPEVNHTLAIPASLAHNDYYNVRIKSLKFIRGLSTNDDLYNFYRLHKSTFEYQSTNADYMSANVNNLATINYAQVKKSSTAIYDRGIYWVGAVNSANQCSKPFNFLNTTNACLYGILYQATWEYEIIR